MAMTLEQQRAVAMASARLRMQEQDAEPPAMPEAQAQPAQQQPSALDYARSTLPGGAAQTLLRAGQGATQLLAHGAASISDVGGLLPNPMSRAIRDAVGVIDRTYAAQNRGYQDAVNRVASVSRDPNATRAFAMTGETMGHMLNPAGAAGAGIASPLARGAVSGSAFAATQPVLDPEGVNYWLEKAKQQAVAVPTGAVASVLTAPRAPKAPTRQELKSQTDAAYKDVRESGDVIPKTKFITAIDDAEAAARKELTYREAAQPKAATALSLIRDELKQAGDNLTLDDIEVSRRLASTALESAQKSDRAVAHRIIDGIDKFVDDFGGASFGPARELYARTAKAETINRLMERAKNAVGANYTQAGYETALRQQFRSLANNERAMRRFSPTEQKAITQVVRGGPVENVLRLIGKAAVRGPVSGAPAGGALFMGEPGIAALIAGGGEVGRWGATQASLRNVRALDEMVRAGSAPQPAVPGPTPNVPVGNLPSALLIQALLRQPRAQ